MFFSQGVYGDGNQNSKQILRDQNKRRFIGIALRFSMAFFVVGLKVSCEFEASSMENLRPAWE